MKVKIGLETHVQLNTQSKIFCGCRNPVNLTKEPEPNTLTCPTCLGLPGSKPRFNRKVMESALGTALALNCKIPKETYFSRKVYFYPDLSKNYQITQYEAPLAENGWIQIDGKRIRITRVHMEEDPSKLIHIGGVGGKYVLADYNRSGIPLIEVVTEPDFTSPGEARLFLQKLENILEYLGVYDSTSRAVFKSDANISLQGGERVEVKNITGTKEIEQALKYEASRQSNLLARGGKIVRETRMWNPDTKSTKALRSKEEEKDYGYILEPDLVALDVSRALVDKVKKGLPELPDQREKRFVSKYKLPDKVAESLVSELGLAELFEWCAEKIDAKLAASWIAGQLKKTLNWNGLKFKKAGVKREWVLEVLVMFDKGKLTDRNAELLFRKLVEEKREPKLLVKKHGLEKIKMNLGKIVKEVVKENQSAALSYKGGEKKVLHFLVGKAVEKTKGRAGAKELEKALLKELK